MARHRSDQTVPVSQFTDPETVQHDLAKMTQQYVAENTMIDPEHFENAKTPFKPWLMNVLDRAGRTALQTAGAFLIVGSSIKLPASETEFLGLLLVVFVSVCLSLATSMASAPSFNNSYWYQVVERAVKTFCQTFVAGASVDVASASLAAFPHNISFVLYSAGTAALSSLLMSVYTTGIGPPNVVDLFAPK